MKKTLHLYIFREISTPFLLGIATFTSVLLLGRLLKIADLVIAKGVPLIDVLLMVVYLLPYFCLVTIPMAFLLAVLLAFGRLSVDGEITAMKAGGISLYGLLPPVITFALLTYLATTFITVYALPWGNVAFKTLLANTIGSNAGLTVKEKVFNDTFPGLMIYVDNYNDKSHEMKGIIVQDERSGVEPSTIFAAHGTLSTDTDGSSVQLRLMDGSIHRTLENNGYRMVSFREYDLSIHNPQSGKGIAKNELDMTFTELRDGIREQRGGERFVRDMQLEFHRRFSLPFACFVFALTGMPLGIQNQRSGRGAGFSLSIGVFIIYYIMLSAGKALGEKGLIHPALAVWAPNILFLILGAWFFQATAGEKRLFIFTITSTIKRIWEKRTPRGLLR